MTPSCVNPTASSVIDIYPFTAASGQGSRQVAGTCQNIPLLIRAQSSNGTAGTIGIIYRIHNMWNQSCILAGYPGVQLLDRKFQSLPTRVHRGGGFVGPVPVRTIPIPAFGNAYFTLFYSDVPAVNQPPCVTAGYVMIFAPNNFLPVVTQAWEAKRNRAIAPHLFSATTFRDLPLTHRVDGRAGQDTEHGEAPHRQHYREAPVRSRFARGSSWR